MKKYLWLLVSVFLGGVAVIIYMANAHHKAKHIQYGATPLTVVLDLEASKPFDLQIFYLTRKDEKFNQQSSIRRKVTPQDTHVEVVLPVKRIYNFRLDFGSYPGKIMLKNIEIKGDLHLNFNNWHNYVYMNMDKTKVKKDHLEIYSEQRDPYMVFQYSFVLDEKI